MPEGTIIVVVIRAKNLPNRRKLEKQNPFCCLRLGNEDRRSKAVVRGGQRPNWNYEERFEIDDETNPNLKIAVFDETKKESFLICDGEIDISPVFKKSSKDGYDNWYPLQYAGRSAGEIYIQMTFYESRNQAKKSAKLKRANMVQIEHPMQHEDQKSLASGRHSNNRNSFIVPTSPTRSKRVSRPLPMTPNRSHGSKAEDEDQDEDYVDTFSTNPLAKLSVSDEEEEEYFRESVNRAASHLDYFQRVNPLIEQDQSRRMSHKHRSQNIESSVSHADILGNTFARDIIRENPSQFRSLLNRNPDLYSYLSQEFKNTKPASASNFDNGELYYENTNKHHNYGTKSGKISNPYRVNSIEQLEKELCATSDSELRFTSRERPRHRTPRREAKATNNLNQIAEMLPRLPKTYTRSPKRETFGNSNGSSSSAEHDAYRSSGDSYNSLNSNYMKQESYRMRNEPSSPIRRKNRSNEFFTNNEEFPYSPDYIDSHYIKSTAKAIRKPLGSDFGLTETNNYHMVGVSNDNFSYIRRPPPRED